jgi:hypothetical protein
MLCSLLLATAVEAAPLSTSPADLILLARSGLSEETIGLFLDTREIGFEVDADMLERLRAEGVSEGILLLLNKSTGARDLQSEIADVSRDYLLPARYYVPNYGYDSHLRFGTTFPRRWFLGHHAAHHRLALGHYSERAFGHDLYRTIDHLGGRRSMRHWGIRHHFPHAVGRAHRRSVGIVGHRRGGHRGGGHGGRH